MAPPRTCGAGSTSNSYPSKEETGENNRHDPNPLLVRGLAGEGKTDEETQRDQDVEERERADYIEAWKEMYRRKGIDPDTYHIDWDAVFEGES